MRLKIACSPQHCYYGLWPAVHRNRQKVYCWHRTLKSNKRHSNYHLQQLSTAWCAITANHMMHMLLCHRVSTSYSCTKKLNTRVVAHYCDTCCPGYRPSTLNRFDPNLDLTGNQSRYNNDRNHHLLEIAKRLGFLLSIAVNYELIRNIYWLELAHTIAIIRLRETINTSQRVQSITF